jgi:hypothetical protein
MAPVKLGSDFLWPTMIEIATLHTTFASESPAQCSRSPTTGLLMFPTRDIWIPSAALHMLLLLLAVAHCGAAGRRSYAVTAGQLIICFRGKHSKMIPKNFSRLVYVVSQPPGVGSLDLWVRQPTGRRQTMSFILIFCTAGLQQGTWIQSRTEG